MTTGKPVCVIGASGFLAAHVVRELLERGYGVRGTVRGHGSLAPYDFLTSLPGANRQLELVHGELGNQASLAAAIAGCEVVIHTASPFVINVKNPQRELVDPAVNGTLCVLRAAAAARVTRVVLTSSMGAVSDEPAKQRVLTEDDWNEQSSLRRNPYYFSKAEAERAAWRFVWDKRPPFDLIAINPYMILGPSIGPRLSASNAVIRDILTGVYPGILSLSWGIVDVRDAAVAHVLAMEHGHATGRYICAGGTLSMAEIIALLRDAGYETGYKLPRLDLTSTLGNMAVKALSYTQAPGTGSYLRTHLGKVMRYDTSKIQRDLGITFRPAADCVLSTAEDLGRWGHLPKPVPDIRA